MCENMIMQYINNLPTKIFGSMFWTKATKWRAKVMLIAQYFNLPTKFSEAYFEQMKNINDKM